MDADVRSPNFGFLSKHDPVLVQLAAFAERYVFEDPNSALIKLRQYGELLSRHTAAYLGVAVPERSDQVAVLATLYDTGRLSPKMAQLFHGLRKAGNEAAHAHTNDQREALHQLRMARELAVWFHRSFGKDRGFQAGPFVPPPSPRDAEQATLDELERLREQLANAESRAEGAEQTAAEEAALRARAESEAASLCDELDAAMALAEESEQNLAQQVSSYEERLVLLQQEVAAEPAEQRDQVAQTAYEEGEALVLDEAATRRIIDQQLRDADWEVDTPTLTYAKGSRPVKGKARAIAEWPTDNGPADYVLFIGLKPVAVVEAKRAGVNVAGSIQQSKRYSRGFTVTNEMESPGGPWGDYNVPFLFASNGRPYLRQIIDQSGVWFLDARVPTNHSRALESWYTPEGLMQLLSQDIAEADERLQTEPPDYLPMRSYQLDAFRAVEAAIAKDQREMLVAMATGTGKTRTAIGLAYRLIKAKRFRRILFLVDRTSLGEQAADSFKDVRLENYQTFTDIYDVKELGDLRPDTDTKLHFATVQGMVKRLLYAGDNDPPVPVDWYDCIIIDECHRGYNLDQDMSVGELEFRSEDDYISKYRRVIDHFDAVKIGLTATPALHTTQIFGPPVLEYSYRQAVIDGNLVDHEPPFRLITQLSSQGMHWDQGEEVEVIETPDAPPRRYPRQASEWLDGPSCNGLVCPRT